MATNHYYGIKFPFTAKSDDGTFVDLNHSLDDRVASEILHVILTPKGERINRPDFGTNLIKWVFEPNDDLTWESVQNEVTESVAKFVQGVAIKGVEIIRDDEDDHVIYMSVSYTVAKGSTTEDKQILVQI